MALHHLQHLHSEAPAPEKHLATILIVDDELVIRELCEKALKDYRVFQAGTCKDALQIYRKGIHRPDPDRCDDARRDGA